MKDLVIALDIGGTNTRCALIDSNYKILASKINPTVRDDTNLFLANVAKTIDETVKDFSNVKCLAMGVPGRVRYDGYINALPNIHIDNIPLADFLAKRYSLPAYVLNDAEVAALAEANLGTYKEEKSLFFVTISTGVGGALTAKGKLTPSSSEIGHTLVSYKGDLYEFEHLCSGTGIVKICALNGLEIKSSKEFFDLLRENNATALKIKKDWLTLLGDWIKMIQEVFEPEVFTLTGGVIKSKDIFFDDLKEIAKGSRLEICSFKQEAGLMGAAVFGFQQK